MAHLVSRGSRGFFNAPRLTRAATMYQYPGEGRSNADKGTRVLITGANGQIGSELVPALRKLFGNDNVIASDIRSPDRAALDGPFSYLDVLNKDSLTRLVLENGIDYIVHNASILSAMGEKNPQFALRLNTRGAENVYEVAAQNNCRVLAPSTIAVFGPTTPQDNTPNTTVMEPTTVYGISKVYGEHLGNYYKQRFGLDFRSLRYPGIISSDTLPGGGTTDYAVEIFYEALKNKKYTCFLRPDSALPMMYMPDCLKATLDLLLFEGKLQNSVFNVTAMSFTPAEMAEAIKEFIPEFEIDYKPDFRQAIADTWPRSLDDSVAREQWQWEPEFDLRSMTKDMLEKLTVKLEKGEF